MNKEITTEDRFHSFVTKHLDYIIFLTIAIIGIAIRIYYAPIEIVEGGQSDYLLSLLPWIREYSQLGSINGLAKGVGNYYIPYNLFLAIIPHTGRNPAVLIALFSGAFDYLMVLAIYKIMKELYKHNLQIKVVPDSMLKCVAIAFSVLPIIVSNSAIWKQCDSIYAGFAMWSLYFLIKEKNNLSLIFLGIAFTFKLQTIFLLPVFIIMYLATTRIKLNSFLWIPLCYIVAGVPAIICGRSVWSTYSIYFGQASSSSEGIGWLFPGLYNFGMSHVLYRELMLVVTVTVFCIALVVIYSIHQVRVIGHAEWLYIGGWCVITCTELLPSMHERYDYLGIILLTVVAVAFRRKIAIPVIMMHLVSACTYGMFLYGFTADMRILAAVYFAAYIWITGDLFKLLKSNELLKES